MVTFESIHFSFTHLRNCCVESLEINPKAVNRRICLMYGHYVVVGCSTIEDGQRVISKTLFRVIACFIFCQLMGLLSCLFLFLDAFLKWLLTLTVTLARPFRPP
jgi:hypothetical protein